MKKVNPDYLLLIKKPLPKPPYEQILFCGCGSDCNETQIDWKFKQPFSEQKIVDLISEHIKVFGNVERRN